MHSARKAVTWRPPLEVKDEDNSARRYRILRRLWATFENETIRCDLASWNYRGGANDLEMVKRLYSFSS